ncbi:hypothetical protein C9993_06415 [Marinobacter sp. Z-F4-2]|nr:hypothetical protein C9993_06415 [Marinobacter sp. Z-F4-2]
MTAGETTEKLVVTHVISGDLWAGAEAQAFQLISALQANNTILPTAVVFNEGPLMQKLQSAGIPVTLANETTEPPWRLVHHLCQHFKDHKTKIVHTHGFKENVLGTLAQKLSRVPKSVRTTHGNPEYELSWRNPGKKLIGLLDQLTARYGQDAVVAVSGQLERDLKKVYGHKTVKILNFIEIPDDSEKKISHGANSNRRDYSQTDIKVGLIGRLVPVKRVDLFIDSIKELNDQLSGQVKGIVIGDGPLMDSLKIYANQQGLAHLIEFRGFVADPTMEIEQMDLLIMPSDHEGIPMVLLEALLARVPIVAHNVGGIPEILANGRCGILVDDHTPSGYAKQSASLLQDPELVADFIRAGRAHLAQNFNKATNALRYEGLYKAIYYEPRYPLDSPPNANA